MARLPPEYLDPATPPDVVVTDRARPPVADPTLGVPVPPAAPAPAAHPLVTVGDSLTQGTTSGAVSRPDLAWPALAAACLGVPAPRAPAFGGPLDGLPLNLEALLRRLQDRFGTGLGPAELVALPVLAHHLLDANEDFWERGPGAAAPPDGPRPENLAIYGWDLRDALSATAGRFAAQLALPERDDFLGVKPRHDSAIAARAVLGPSGADATQLVAAARLGDDGGIGTLVVALGANNALRGVVDKAVVWSGDGYADLDAKEGFTVWRPVHFAAEYAALVAAVRGIRAQRVVLATVPHVTIAPIARGVNPAEPGRKWRPGSRYFPWYADPWLDDARFRPERHRHLTHQQARAVDSAIDQYNDTVAAAVRAARAEGRQWLLFDLCAVLDGLARRRFRDDPAAAAHHGWEPRPLPAPIADLDTRFFRADARGRSQGGLFGLDAVHPTTSAYGVVAAAFLDVVAAAGVPAAPLDFADLAARDTLNREPPALLDAVVALLTPFLTRLVSRRGR